MTTQHLAVFHCQTCGRLVYQPRGGLTPVCCGAPMVCAIADMVRETPVADASRELSDRAAARTFPSERVSL
jgi:hypothetical protein